MPPSAARPGFITRVMTALRDTIDRGLAGGVSRYEAAATRPDPFDRRSWDDYDTRVIRYRLGESYAIGHPYDGSEFAASHRDDEYLYRWIRPIENPGPYLAEYHGANIMGGLYDAAAGDGRAVPTGIPIVITDDDADTDPGDGPDDPDDGMDATPKRSESDDLRACIAALWSDSHWERNRILYGRIGSIQGDVALKIDDDPSPLADPSADDSTTPSPPRLRVVPGINIKWLYADGGGGVIAYQLEEYRVDPEWRPDAKADPTRAVWGERGYRNAAGEVVVRTTRNGTDYAWPSLADPDVIVPAIRIMPYRCIPLVHVPHIAIGAVFGMGEALAHLPKFRQVDEIGSALDDQVLNVLNGPWAINCPRPPDDAFQADETEDEYDEFASPRRGVPSTTDVRGAVAFMWLDRPELKAVHLVGDMPIDEVTARLKEAHIRLERSLPELADGAADYASGRAKIIANSRAEKKIVDRRKSYDAALVQAHKIGVVVGVARGIPAYSAYVGVTDTADPRLDHQIGNRAVQSVHPLDEYELMQSFYTAGVQAKNADVPVEVFLQRAGWSAADIAAVVRIRDEKAAKAQEMALEAATAQPNNSGKDDDAGNGSRGENGRARRPPRPIAGRGSQAKLSRNNPPVSTPRR